MNIIPDIQSDVGSVVAAINLSNDSVLVKFVAGLSGNVILSHVSNVILLMKCMTGFLGNVNLSDMSE